MYIDKLINKLSQYNNILIYGAGGVAEDFLLLLIPYKERIDIGVVTSKKSDSELLGIPVREISEYKDEASSSLVIISAMPRYIDEMKTVLIDNGFTNYTDVYSILGDIYSEIWQEKIVNNKIIISNYKGLGFGDNGKYIALNLLKLPNTYDIVWAVGEDKYTFPEGIRTVVYGSYEYYYELGTAHIWIDNRHKSRLSYKRKGQFYIQTWHGGGPLKKIEHDGNSISQSYLDLCDYDSELIDLMISPTAFNSRLYRSAFNYDGEILECGYPRNDIFFQNNSTKKKIEDELSVSEENIIVLYAPTFRNSKDLNIEELNLSKVRESVEKLYDRKVEILVRLHPDLRNKDVPSGVINASYYDDTQELLAASDVLITDYSSIMWDFSLQIKPVFLFQPDNDGYEEERGYYLSFEKMPYILARSTQELCSKIESFDENLYREGVTVFLKKYGSFDKGIAACKICEYIESICRVNEDGI